MVKSAHSCKTTGSSLMLSWLAYICISCDIAIYRHNLWHVNMAGIGFCHPKKTNAFPFSFSLRKKKAKRLLTCLLLPLRKVWALIRRLIMTPFHFVFKISVNACQTSTGK